MERFRRQMYYFMADNNYSTFVRDYSQTLGAEDAKVYVVVFFDTIIETALQSVGLLEKRKLVSNF